MIIPTQEYNIKGLRYLIRSATIQDSIELSNLRVKIDGETEFLDREPGEAYIDKAGFKQLIQDDSDNKRNLFLVAEVEGKLVGFSRCEGNLLKRTAHKVEFGICILKDYWGYGIGRNLLQETIHWADSNHIEKISLSVLETNHTAIQLYEKLGFEKEGVLRHDKRLSDGNFYNTILMGRLASRDGSPLPLPLSN